MPILTLIPIFGYAFTFHLQWKKSISVSLFFSITFILSTVFLIGTMGLLQWGSYLVFFAGSALFIYNLYKYQNQLKETLSSPPFVIYSVLSFFSYFVFKDMSLFFWDEYSHWGPFIKNMYLFNEFPKNTNIGTHFYYPPGAAVWNYFGLLFSPYNEGTLFFSYFLLLFSSTLVMYEKITWDRWYYLALVLSTQLVLFSLFGHWFTSIYVDHVIGALFTGLILSYISDRFTAKETLFFLFPLLSLLAIKEAGFFFACSALGTYFLLTFFSVEEEKNPLLQRLKNNKEKLAVFAFLFVTLFSFQKYWGFYLENKGIQKGKHSMTHIVSSIVTGERSLSEKQLKKTKENFWTVVFSQQLHKEEVSLNYNESSVNILPRFKKTIKLTYPGFFLFFIFLLCLSHYYSTDPGRRKTIKTLGCSLLFIYSIYLAVLFMSYMIALGAQGIKTPSYVRYINIATLGLSFAAFSLFLPFFQKKIQSNQNLMIANAFALFALIFITRPYLTPLYSQISTTSRQKIKKAAEIIKQQVPAKSKILVVFPNLKGSMYDPMLRYYLIPAKSSISSRDFLTKSPSEIQKIYANYDHIWFPQLSQKLVVQNRGILQKKMTGGAFTLYKVDKKSRSYGAIL